MHRPVWKTEYRQDRRLHRHRCRCCSRIIQPGEDVLMLRIQKTTIAIHEACADTQHGDAAWTWRDAMQAWAKG